ncbi:MAG: hypothetical protein Fur0037_04890 [Planctomycetota bacterium]
MTLPEEARRARDLLVQIEWFNRLRLLAAASAIWLTALAVHVLDVPLDPWPLYTLGASIAAVDGLFLLVFPRLRSAGPRGLSRHVALQIALDILILTLLLHFSGGITNPLVLFYLFHTFVAALLLSVKAAVLVSAGSLAALAALGLSERRGWVAHHPLGLGLFDLFQIKPLGLLLLFLAYALTSAFSIYFVATVLRRLRERERQIVHMGRHLALSEKLASVGTLAAGVSHEINNPVGVIRNKVQILRYRIQDGDGPDKLLSELDAIDKHSRRIAQITDGLLAFSRETPFALKPTDLHALVREAAELVRVPFKRAEVELDLVLAETAPKVMGSGNHLLQVLINILLNAKDASHAGSIVRVATDESGGEAAVAITDFGVGISEENLAKIFDPFFTTKDVDRGTGLGLAISHGIVQRHGGRIEVESAPGQGATFRVVLPLAGGS